MKNWAGPPAAMKHFKISFSSPQESTSIRTLKDSHLIQTLEVVVEVGAADVVWMGH